MDQVVVVAVLYGVADLTEDALDFGQQHLRVALAQSLDTHVEVSAIGLLDLDENLLGALAGLLTLELDDIRVLYGTQRLNLSLGIPEDVFVLNLDDLHHDKPLVNVFHQKDFTEAAFAQRLQPLQFVELDVVARQGWKRVFLNCCYLLLFNRFDYH